jgi:bifunctional non-homologous end joining protein LigD
VTFSHPEKKYFPSGYSEGDMLGYYIAGAKTLRSYLRDRPVTLVRFPEGVKGESFYENAPHHTPEWIKTFPVPRREHEGFIDYTLVNNRETLA